MRKFAIAIAVMGVGMGMLVGSAFSQMENKSQALKDLVESEKAFSKTSEAKGIREAFLTYLADGSIVFRPRPVPGRQTYEQMPSDSLALLTWTPHYVEVAAAGDLGYTTGPYMLKANRSDAQPSAYGHYVSVWKRQADGSWKVLLDIGTSHPEPGPNVEGVESRKPVAAAESAAVDAEKESHVLIDKDRALAGLARRKGILEAYLFYADEEVRLYRQNSLPVVGKDVLPVVLTGVPGELTCNPLGSGVSLSGDLGYTYGISEWKMSGAQGVTAESSSYLRIWRKTAEGNWLVALDVAVPIPNK
jgi:ketosteroid isomerase-like protein